MKRYHTYDHLPAFGLQFAPDWLGADGEKLGSLKNAFAFDRFGSAHNPETRFFHFDKSKALLSPEWSVASERERARLDVRLFVERKASHIEGVKLGCLYEPSLDNMRPSIRGIFTHGARI